MSRVSFPYISCTFTACRVPGIDSTFSCASSPLCTATTLAAVPNKSNVVAIPLLNDHRGPNGMSDTTRATTPTMRSATTKCTTCG